jgi:hypothetical protein
VVKNVLISIVNKPKIAESHEKANGVQVVQIKSHIMAMVAIEIMCLTIHRLVMRNN